MADQRTIDSQAADVFNPRNITGTEPDHPSRKLRCVVVTPEKALLDEYCDLVVLPMFDGEHGVLPNHSPFVGQLGPGELRITVAGKVRRYFIDGGFAQVRANVVNVLTPKANLAKDLTPTMVEKFQTEADALPTTNTVENETRQRAQARAKAMARVAAKAANDYE